MAANITKEEATIYLLPSERKTIISHEMSWQKHQTGVDYAAKCNYRFQEIPEIMGTC